MRKIVFNVSNLSIEEAVRAVVWRLGAVRRQTHADEDASHVLVVNASTLTFPDQIEIHLERAAKINADMAKMARVELFCDTFNRLIDSDSLEKYRDIEVIPGGNVPRGHELIDIPALKEEYMKYIATGNAVGGWLAWENRIRKILNSSLSDRLNGTFALLAYTAARVEDTSITLSKMEKDTSVKLSKLQSDLALIKAFLLRDEGTQVIPDKSFSTRRPPKLDR